MHLAHIALLVADYDEAIAWYVGRLGFTLVEDTFRPEQGKRWVTVRPPGAPAHAATILLARAARPEQARFVGDQAGGRVFLFLATDDFARDHAAFTEAGVEWVRPPATHAWGTVAVFRDLYGNLWDLIEHAPRWMPARHTGPPRCPTRPLGAVLHARPLIQPAP